MYYIANSFFELELEGKAGSKLREAFTKNAHLKQLQYLPLLFLSPEDTLFVTELPTSIEPNGPKLKLLEEPVEPGILHSWGASEIIAKWANDKGLYYDMPPMDVSKKVNSKIWNFEQHPSILGGKVIAHAEEIASAVQRTSFPWVLKTDQGFAGRGHLIFNAQEISKGIEFAKKFTRPLILEPWVERVCDFSSQWLISKEGGCQLLGVTKCINTPAGGYLGTEAGNSEEVFGSYLPFVKQHLESCEKHLKVVAKEGFFGNLGVDAMIFNEGGQLNLYPILEVNARMTMSSAILLYHKQHGKNKVSRVYYTADTSSHEVSLLPEGYKRKLVIKL